jgi:hypothetical protein
MFTVFAKRIFVLQSASPCNAATVCFSYRLNSRLNDVVVESGGSLLPISLRRLLIFNGSEAPIFESCNFSRCYVPFETEKETNTNPNKIILKLEK